MAIQSRITELRSIETGETRGRCSGFYNLGYTDGKHSDRGGDGYILSALHSDVKIASRFDDHRVSRPRKFVVVRGKVCHFGMTRVWTCVKKRHDLVEFEPPDLGDPF